MQRLHASLADVAALPPHEELRGLSEWVNEHEHLRGCGLTPRSEASLPRMADKRIDEKEHEMRYATSPSRRSWTTEQSSHLR